MSINYISNPAAPLDITVGCNTILFSALELGIQSEKVFAESKAISTDELALLGKLEEANRYDI